MPQFTLASANKALRAAGFKERLVRGGTSRYHYFYFIDGEAWNWKEQSIPTQSLAGWNAEKIICERNSLAGEASPKGATK